MIPAQATPLELKLAGGSSHSLIFQPFACAPYHPPAPVIACLGELWPAGQNCPGEFPIKVAVAADPNPDPNLSAAQGDGAVARAITRVR